jgi:hypothetical protein
MTLTAIVGALIALVPAAKSATRDAEIERLERAIENLERDLLIQRDLTVHWRETAQRIAKQNREAREAHVRERAGWQQHNPVREQQEAINRQAQLMAQAMQAQHYASMVPSDLGQGQLGQQAAQNQPMQHWEGFCNCVPSRAQVWGAQGGLVQQLNDRSL